MKSKITFRTTLAVTALLAATVALQGCWNPEEQNRVLRYEKGTYLGKQDSKLSEDELNNLRARVSSQRGS